MHSASFVDWLLNGSLSPPQLVFFLKILVRNDAFLDALVFEGHLLYELPDFEDPASQSLVHFAVACALDDFCGFHGGAAFYF
jgi:hypothetical protein